MSRAEISPGQPGDRVLSFPSSEEEDEASEQAQGLVILLDVGFEEGV